MGLCLKRATPSQDAPGAGPSGGVPGVSSTRATAPKDLPEGQDVEAKDSDVDDPDPVSSEDDVLVCVLVFHFKVLKSKKINNRK